MSTAEHQGPEGTERTSKDADAVSPPHLNPHPNPHLNPRDSQPHASVDDDEIVSVNERHAPAPRSRIAKAAAMVVSGAVLVGGSLWFGQHWLTQMKNTVRERGLAGKSSSASPEGRNLLNPEDPAAGGRSKPVKLGADAVAPAAAAMAAASAAPAANQPDDIRPLRGADGKVMVDGTGKPLGVDARGNVVTVPAIAAIGGDGGGRKPLPDAQRADAAMTGMAGTNVTAASPPKPPSRYGGALFADASTSAGATPGGVNAPNARQSQTGAPGSGVEYTELLRALMSPTLAGQAAPAASAGQTQARSGEAGEGAGVKGPVASQLGSSATPVARARLMTDQDLVLPKGRQADCVLTTRIINELPGFTNCTLTQNLYSANGRVLLLERGASLDGEYGVSSQLGLRRLFVVWTRARTPDGVEIDLQSPGTDPLGTSGIPGYLEQRWSERIGAALLLSVMKDAVAIEVAKQSARSADNSTVVVQQPGQNTIQTGQQIAEQVLRQTMNVKPTLYINQGERISIYVARDLEFSPVYALKANGAGGTAKVN